MHNTKAHILVVDDDSRLRNLLMRYLLKMGYFVTAVCDTKEARKAMSVFKFDLVILDVLLPEELGTEFAYALKKVSQVSILMLSALDAPLAKVRGLKSGVDDYMTKPFNPEELHLRIGNLLKRAKFYSNDKAELLTFNAFKYDKSKGVLYHRDNIVRLGRTERVLLAALTKSANTVVSREDLAVLSGVSPKSIDVQVKRLRSKIENDPQNPSVLQAVRGSGYILYAY